MLAPIITKDMRLFPTQRVPIRNVRSRAQSLDHFQQLQSSSSTIDRLVPVKPRGSMSTGNISNGKQSASRQKAGQAKPSQARSPPKSTLSRKTTLTAIQEGVELTGIPNSPSESSSVQSESSRKPRANKKGIEEEAIFEEMSEREVGEPNSNDEIKKKRGVFKWITNTFRKSREKVSDSASTTSD